MSGSRLSNRINLLVNILLAAMVVDMGFARWLMNDYNDLQFLRIGYVSERGVRLAFRSTASDPLTITLVSDVKGDGGRQVTVSGFLEDQDYIKTITVDQLRPDTRYDYTISSRSNSIQSGHFDTAPLAHSSKWSFAATSCLVADFPYNPLKVNHIAGATTLSRSEYNAPSSNYPLKKMFFLGDFIYFDLPYFPNPTLAAYRKKYRATYASPSYRTLYRSLPILNVYDDHELLNNWDGGESHPWPIAHSAFMTYHGNSNPQPMRRDQTWYAYTYGGIDFFMLDTRRYRSRNMSPDDSHKTMLGPEQLEDFLSWLTPKSNDGVFKVAISSVPFTQNWKGVDGHLDTWGSFMTERAIIMRAIQRSGIQVIVISGDRHEFAATQIIHHEPLPSTLTEQTKKEGTVVEFSISPMNQFYPPVPTYSPHGNDTQLAYIPQGNQKVGFFAVDTTGEIPRIEFTLQVYGKQVWNYTIYA